MAALSSGRGCRRAVRAAPAIVLLIVVAATGCARHDSTVGIVGDSITLQLVDELRRVADDRWILDIHPEPGATVGEMLPTVAEVAAAKPSQVVINLGTNNVLRDVSLEESTAEIEQMFELLDEVPCVHVVTVHDDIFSWDEGYLTDRSRAFNRVLVDHANGHGASVIDWNAVLTEASVPENAPAYLADTVHLTPEGIGLLARVYGSALADGCS